MSKSLPLLLERAISSSRRSSALELPLDRKIGGLSRYTYVYADALPLRMERKISEQPAPKALYLAMSQPLGTLAPLTYVTSNALPLPLSVLISEQPPSNALPLGMTRKIGTLVSAPVIVPPIDPVDPEEPVDPELPLEYAPPIPNISSCFTSRTNVISTIYNSQNWTYDGALMARDSRANRSSVMTISQCYALRLRAFIPLTNCAAFLTGLVYKLSNCNSSRYLPFIPIHNPSLLKVSASIGYTSCTRVYSATSVEHNYCATLPLQAAINYAASIGDKQHGVSLGHCQRAKVQQAIPVPDRYYPIPEPPPVKPISSCRLRPSSSELPLRMSRQRRGLLSSNLPLSLTCWHDDPPLSIPNLRSYIVHNVITATIGGIVVDPISCGINTDMDSYCWQGNIGITAKDYAKIKAKLDVPQGSEPMVNVEVNGLAFSFIAENQQRNRQFANHSHSLSGRSITARLGADYALSQGGLIGQASFVSQIAAQQLNGLSVSILDWGINDWLVPADAYSVAGKTPIAVLVDIAKAGGGFIMSDLSQPTISLRPRWKSAAWDMATATPDVIVPIDVMRQISDQKRINPRYNIVLLNSDTQGAKVFRTTQARNAEAPSQDHPLYTDRDAMIPAGTSILSDSGIHADYTLKLRLADKYNIPLAVLGDVWQVNDPEGAWRGIVTGVSADIDKDNDAPTVWQTVNIDRYLDV